MEKVTLGNTVTRIGNMAFYNAAITKLVCPESLKSIESMAFYMCSSLASVTLNDGLESIDGTAFYFTSVTELVIPEYCVVPDAMYYYTSSNTARSITCHYKTTVTLNANGVTVNGAATATTVQYEKEACAAARR